MTDAERERAAIVAWLRREQAQNEIVNVGGELELSAKRFAIACMVIADIIERGDHLQPEAK